MGSSPILPASAIETINILLSSKLWLVGALIAAVFSANVSNLLLYLKTKNEVVWIMINSLPIFVALVVVGS